MLLQETANRVVAQRNPVTVSAGTSISNSSGLLLAETPLAALSASAENPGLHYATPNHFASVAPLSLSLTDNTAVNVTPVIRVSKPKLLRVSTVDVENLTWEESISAAKKACLDAKNGGALQLTVTNINKSRGFLRHKLIRMWENESVCILDSASTFQLTHPRYNLHPIVSLDKREIAVTFPTVTALLGAE